jgi:integrase
VSDDEITISRNRVLVDGATVEGTPKSGTGRTVALHPRTVESLNRWRRRQLEDRMAAGPVWTDTGYVFTDELGAPLAPYTVSKRFAAAVKAAGLPAIRLHDLRHTSATLALLAGIPVHVVAARLGHSDPAITLRVYSHLLPTSQWDAAERIGAALYG